MKNLFNNISEEEKNRILEMHSSKKNVISEEMLQSDTKNMWTPIEKGLINFNAPKVIKSKTMDSGKPFTTLNWGSHKEKGHNWGVSIDSSDPRLSFTTSDEIQGKIYKQVTGSEPTYNKLSKRWSSTDYKLDYSNPTKVISLIKELVSSLE